MRERMHREDAPWPGSLATNCVSCYRRWPCDGFQTEEYIAVLEAALARLQSAWDDLCRCNDEFLPDYPEACGEYQHNLDLAVIALLATRAGADADG